MASQEFLSLPPFKYKPHIAVLTDICNEPDDAESMTRFLLYANEFDISALVATTSTWQRNSTHKQEIHRIIDAYAGVEETLNQHVPPSRKYPTADSLREVVRSGLGGYGMESARGEMSEGTELLIQAVDQISSDDHIWIIIWGGANVLAQALLSIQKTRTASEILLFTSKLRVYAISDQDDAGPWIRLTFPKIFYIASVHAFNMYGLAAWSGISGESYYRFNKGGPDSSLVTKEWLKKNIQIGPYGTVYPDPVFIPEGDTPTFLSLIQNGLTDPLKPDWGGWGGRYRLTDPSGESGHYSDTADSVVGQDGEVHFGNQATIWRWREAYQGDFKGRIQWTMSSEFGAATHAPIVVLNGDSALEALEMKISPGSVLKLDASGSWAADKGAELEFKWMHYQEPTATQWTIAFEVPKLEFEDASTGHRKMEKVDVRIPGKEEGLVHPLNGSMVPWGNKTYHLILEVVNKGKCPMRSYRRVLVEVVDE